MTRPAIQPPNWKTFQADRTINFQFPGLSVIVLRDMVSFSEEEEAQVIAVLRDHNITDYSVTELPLAPVEPAPPAEISPETVSSNHADRLASLRRGAQVESDTPTTPQSISPPVPSELPLVAESAEEQMQKEFAISKAIAVSIVDELTGLVRTSLTFYYRNLRDRVCELSKQTLEKEREYLNLSVAQLTHGFVSKAVEKIITVGLPKEAKRIKERLEAFDVTASQIDTAMTSVKEKVRHSMTQFTESQTDVKTKLKELVRFQVEKEQLFQEVAAQKDVDAELKRRIRTELTKISNYDFVDSMWCEKDCFVVKVKDVVIRDPQNKNKEFKLGEYKIYLNLKKVESGNILRVVHVGTPHADYMHPHISSGGNNICFGSGNTASGIMKLIGEFDLALAVELLYRFLNMYNPKSPYQKPYPLMQHWKNRDNWKEKT